MAIRMGRAGVLECICEKQVWETQLSLVRSNFPSRQCVRLYIPPTCLIESIWELCTSVHSYAPAQATRCALRCAAAQ
jgi:hypothetical protein